MDEHSDRNARLSVKFASWVSVLAMAVSGGAFIVRFNDAAQGRENNKKVWHAVLCHIETTVLKTKTISDVKKQEAINFYDNLLTQDVKTTGCGLKVTTK